MVDTIHQKSVKCTVVAPFANGARRMLEAGLCPIPCRGDDGKKPDAYAWGKWKNPPSAEFLAKMVGDHPDANVGILCGPLSGVTIIDVDDPLLVEAMLKRFGDTLIITRTPSKGVHLWYRWNGEGCPTHLRRDEGLLVDVKGKGGFSVEPPSIRPADGAPYTFERGSLECIHLLSPVHANSLLRVATRPNKKASEQGSTSNPDVGMRDTTLFAFARQITPYHFPDDRNGLRAAVLTRNDSFTCPLPKRQAIQKADQAWKYAKKGTLLLPGDEPTVIIPFSLIKAYADSPDVLWFEEYLRANHGADPNKTFAVTPKSIANGLPKLWSHMRVRKCRDAMLERGRLELVKVGKSYRHSDGTLKQTPNQYKLVPLHRGNGSLPNITKHLSPHPVGEYENDIVVFPFRQLDLFNGDSLKLNRKDLNNWSGGVISPAIRNAVIYELRRRSLRHVDLANCIGLSRSQLTNVILGRFGLGKCAAEELKQWLLEDP
jgi:hypothetical protein